MVIGVLVFFHELGHFLAAKASGMLVQEFALGMGPTIFSITRGETKYALRMLPVGGFLRVVGEENEDGKELIPESRRYDKKPVWMRMAFVAGGPIFNFVLAALIFAVMFVFIGVPSTQPIIGSVSPSWPAAEAGLKTGDRIDSIAGVPVKSWSDLQQVVSKNSDQPLLFVVNREGAEHVITIIPKIDETSNRAMIGVSPHNVRYNVFRSLFLGAKEMVWFTGEIISVLTGMLTGRTPAEGAGPIGMVVMVGQVARTGIVNLLSFAAIISIQLGLFNLLPIPALDGSKLVFLTLEGLRGKPIDPERENMVHFIGFVLLMALLIIITFKDLQRLNIF